MLFQNDVQILTLSCYGHFLCMIHCASMSEGTDVFLHRQIPRGVYCESELPLFQVPRSARNDSGVIALQNP
jgi:hypothetical protein